MSFMIHSNYRIARTFQAVRRQRFVGQSGIMVEKIFNYFLAYDAYDTKRSDNNQHKSPGSLDKNSECIPVVTSDRILFT